MSFALVVFMLAGGSLAPEPTRTFVTSTARASVTMGAMYFVNAPVHSMPAVPAQPVQPVPMPPPAPKSP